MGKIRKDDKDYLVTISLSEMLDKTITLALKHVSFTGKVEDGPVTNVLDITTITIRDAIEQSIWKIVQEKMKTNERKTISKINYENGNFEIIFS